MGEIALALLKWTLTIAFFIPMVLAFLVIVNLIGSLFVIGVSLNVINDLLVLIQMWAPFNISVLLLWVSTAVVAFFGYKIAVVSLNYVRMFLDT